LDAQAFNLVKYFRSSRATLADHAVCEVVGANQVSVHTGHRRDGVEVLHRFDRLNLNNNGLLLSLGAACVAHELHHIGRVLRGVDVWHHQSIDLPIEVLHQHRRVF